MWETNLADTTASLQQQHSWRLHQPVDCALALCAVRLECVRLMPTQSSLLFGDLASALQVPVSELATAAGSMLHSLLQSITEHDVQQHLQTESGTDMSYARAAVMDHPALALRLHQLGWPMGRFLDEVAEFLFMQVQDISFGDLPQLGLLAFIPTGLDLTDYPAEEPYQSPLTVARKVASSVEAAQLAPGNMTELLQQDTADWSSALTKRAYTPAAYEAAMREHLQLSVQLVHEWRLHSDKLHALLLGALSSSSNGARVECDIIGQFLDFEPSEQ